MVGADGARWARRDVIMMRLLGFWGVFVLVNSYLLQSHPLIGGQLELLLIPATVILFGAFIYMHLKFMAVVRKRLGNISWTIMWSMPMPYTGNIGKLNTWLKQQH